jgi:hypothetical protein
LAFSRGAIFSLNSASFCPKDSPVKMLIEIAIAGKTRIEIPLRISNKIQLDYTPRRFAVPYTFWGAEGIWKSIDGN